jgi:hypothetical protein
MSAAASKRDAAEAQLTDITVKLESVAGMLGCIALALETKGENEVRDAGAAATLLQGIVHGLAHDLCGVEI